MEKKIHIYGMQIEHTDGTRTLGKYVFDDKPTPEVLQQFAEGLSKVYSKTPEDILDALFLFEKMDDLGKPTGEPAEFSDLFEPYEVVMDETPSEILVRLQAEADIEAAEQGV